MITLSDVSFTYTVNDAPTLKDINLQVDEGECILLCGKSGCGKSTLLNLINGIIPTHIQGVLEGTILVNGIVPQSTSIQALSATVGSVFQNPKSQFFSLNTTNELLFACSNHKVSRPVMLTRLEDTITELNIQHLLDRNIFDLSGGEKQKLACASVYMNRPRIYVFDEPSANLDAHAINDLKQIIQTLKNAGNTVLIAEHRLYYLIDLCDRFIYLDEGIISDEFTRDTFVNLGDAQRRNMGLRTIREQSFKDDAINHRDQSSQTPEIIVEELICHYKRKQVLNIQNLHLPKHKVIAVIGRKGAGKSTFGAAFSGILKSKSRIVDEKILKPKERIQRTFMVMQDVNYQLFSESVLDELMLGFEFDDQQKLSEANDLLEQLNLLPYKDQHPLCLSGGQKQRTAIATALCTDKQYL
ncbi:MAG: ABC transporter ATP-binding protein, partial [Chloroflexota bacterium]